MLQGVMLHSNVETLGYVGPPSDNITRYIEYTSSIRNK